MSTPSPGSAVLDRHASLSGSVSGDDLIVLGSLEGDLRLSGRLHIAAGSRLRARVEATVVELEGDFEGEVRAETLRVAATARAKGVFVATRLSMQEGAILEGNVQAPAELAPAPVVAIAVALEHPTATDEQPDPPALEEPVAAPPA